MIRTAATVLVATCGDCGSDVVCRADDRADYLAGLSDEVCGVCGAAELAAVVR